MRRVMKGKVRRWRDGSEGNVWVVITLEAGPRPLQ